MRTTNRLMNVIVTEIHDCNYRLVADVNTRLYLRGHNVQHGDGAKTSARSGR